MWGASIYKKVKVKEGELQMIKGKAIGIITSGGDCGGLNAVIKGCGRHGSG